MLPPRASLLPAARERIAEYLRSNGIESADEQDIVLSIEEACANSIRHSRVPDDIEVELRFEADELVATVKDKGPGFDLSSFDPLLEPDVLSPRGRGLFLISRLMDELTLSMEGGLQVRMKKRCAQCVQRRRQYTLSDLVDVEELQILLDRLHLGFNCPSAIVDSEANVLTATGWQDICTQFHRQHPETLAECRQSDLHIYHQLCAGEQTVAYRCPRGMIDCASPIVIDGRHLGNVFIGQVLLEPPDLESFREQARRFGFDEEGYVEAARHVPVLTQEELERRIPFVRALAEMIAELGLARLHDRELNEELERRSAENERLYAEQLHIAETLQENLRHPVPVIPGVSIGLVSKVAAAPQMVGGDFSDVFTATDGRVVILIGDVAGKGIRAAGLTETVRSTVRAFAMVNTSPAVILTRTSEVLQQHGSEEELVTALLLVLDPQGGELVYSSAAHPPPAVVSAASARFLHTAHGLPLGSFAGEYADEQAALARGESLVLYTDGVTEARRDGEFFGYERLLATLKEIGPRAAQDLADALESAVEDFATTLRDDLHVVAVQLTS